MSRYIYVKPSRKKRMVLSFDGEQDLIVNRRTNVGYDLDDYVMVTGTPAPKPVVAPKPAPRPAVAPRVAPKPVVSVKTAPRPAVAPRPAPKPLPAPNVPVLNLPNLNTMNCNQLKAEIIRATKQMTTIKNAALISKLRTHIATARNLSVKKCAVAPKPKDSTPKPTPTPAPTQEVTSIFPDLETLDCDGIKSAIDNATKTLQTAKFSNPNSRKQYEDFIASAKAMQTTKCQTTPPPVPMGGGGGGATPPPEEEPQPEEGQEQGEQPQEGQEQGQGEQPQAEGVEAQQQQAEATPQQQDEEKEQRKRNTYYVLGVIGLLALVYFLNE